MKTQTIQNLYDIIFIQRTGTAKDAMYLKNSIRNLTTKIMSSKKILDDHPYYGEMIDFCEDEVIHAMSSLTKDGKVKIPAEDIYKYAKTIISNSINGFQKRLYQKEQIHKAELPTQTDKDGKEKTIEIPDTNSSQVFSSFVNSIREQYPTRECNWFIQHYIYGISVKDISKEVNISESYISREIKRFISTIKKNNLNELYDCLEQLNQCKSIR